MQLTKVLIMMIAKCLTKIKQATAFCAYIAYFILLQQKQTLIQIRWSLYLLYYTKACHELAGPIFASLRLSNTAFFEEMLQWWRAVGNTVSYLTGPRFEPLTSCSRDKRVAIRPRGCQT